LAKLQLLLLLPQGCMRMCQSTSIAFKGRLKGLAFDLKPYLKGSIPKKNSLQAALLTPFSSADLIGSHTILSAPV
jgi:hypothetical protein